MKTKKKEIEKIYLQAKNMHYNNQKRKGGFTIYQKMLREYERIDSRIKYLQKQMKEMPEGKLVSGRNGAYQQWFISDGHVSQYIPKKNRKQIEKLALKKYFSCELEDLLQEKLAIECYLKQHQEGKGNAEKLLTDTSAYREYILSYFKLESMELQEWLQEPFEKNPNYKENLILKSISGNLVRSKSELLIDSLLFSNKIPYRYECELNLGRHTVYPDFTIKHPKTGKLYYWEHFGMMDDEEYVKKTCLKIQQYASNGIVPGDNLIMTFETQENPFGTEDVMRVLEEYFLD